MLGTLKFLLGVSPPQKFLQTKNLSPFNPISLKFQDKGLEALFLGNFYGEQCLNRRKKFLFIGAFMLMAWFLLDYLTADASVLGLTLTARGCASAWSLIAYGTLFFKHPLLTKIDGFIWGFTCLFIPLMFTLIGCLKQEITVSASTMIAMVGVNIFIDVPFRSYMPVNLILPVCFGMLFAYVGKGPQPIVADSSVAVLLVSVLLTLNSYFTERHHRNEFRMTQAMEEQWRLRAEEALELSRVSKLADEAKSRFLAVMSHEMRGPLHAIYSMTQLLSHSQLNPQDEECVVIIERSSELLLSLISDVLDVSRFDSNTLKLQLEPIDVFETVEDVAYICESEVYKRDALEVFVKFSPGVPVQILGDKNRLKQIILNLAWNAVKFCQAGTISIEVAVADSPPVQPPPCTAYAVAQEVPLGPCLSVTVRDTGVGINSADLPKIFEEFWQKDTSATRKYNGAGLGLSICKKLTKAMGGQLVVTSLPSPPGTAFTLYLPLHTLHVATQQSIPNSLEFVTTHYDHGDQPGDASKRIFSGDLRVVDPAIGDFPISPDEIPGSPRRSAKLAVFVNQSRAAAEVLAAYFIPHGFQVLFFQSPHEMRSEMSLKHSNPPPQIALVFLDSNTCERSPPSLRWLMARSRVNSIDHSAFAADRGHAFTFPLHSDSLNLGDALPRRPHTSFSTSSHNTINFDRRESISAPPSFGEFFAFSANGSGSDEEDHDEHDPNDRTPFFPFIFVYVTNTQDRVDDMRVHDCGFSIQLQKPVKVRSLTRVIKFGQEACAARAVVSGISNRVKQLQPNNETPVQVSWRVRQIQSFERGMDSAHRDSEQYESHDPCDPRPPQAPPPAPSRSSAQSDASHLASATKQSQIRVLVVEDNAVNRRIMQKMLPADKYSVTTASDGLEALKQIDDSNFDVVLMDLHMPNMGGIEATMKIRARCDAKRNVPICALSADVLQETLDEAYGAGVNEFLTKPLKMEDLFATIQKLTRSLR